jgi:hypothetical protein
MLLTVRNVYACKRKAIVPVTCRWRGGKHPRIHVGSTWERVVRFVIWAGFLSCDDKTFISSYHRTFPRNSTTHAYGNN